MIDFEIMQEDIKDIKLQVSKMTEGKKYFTAKEAAEYLTLSVGTIHNNKSEIGFSRPDRVVIFRKQDLDAWFEKFYVTQK